MASSCVPTSVDYVNSTVGAGGPNPTPNTGRMFIVLKDRAQRPSSIAIIQRLRAATSTVPGIVTYYQNVQNLNVTGRASKSEFQYTLQSSDTEALYRLAAEMRAEIAKVPGLRDVNSDLYIKNPQMGVEIDREKAAVYGITIDQIRQEMFNAFGTRQVATHLHADQRLPGRSWKVSRNSKPTSRRSAHLLKTSSGQMVPLEAVTRIVPSVGPLLVNHQGSQPAVTIAFNLAPGNSLGPAVDAIQEIERKAGLPASITDALPGLSGGFPGISQRAGRAGVGGDLRRLCSARHPVRELHPSDHASFPALPSAGIGALLTLLAFRMDLSVIAMIGIIMLVGIVKKNAIMMIDFRARAATCRHGTEAAIREACLLRFRPIMMTTFAAIFGALPIAFGTGAGSELRRPLGVAVVGGLRPVAAAHALHHARDLHLPRPDRPHAQASARAAARGGAGTAGARASGRRSSRRT